MQPWTPDGHAALGRPGLEHVHRLEDLSHRSWPPLLTAPLGGWTLRAGAGITPPDQQRLAAYALHPDAAAAPDRDQGLVRPAEADAAGAALPRQRAGDGRASRRLGGLRRGAGARGPADGGRERCRAGRRLADRGLVDRRDADGSPPVRGRQKACGRGDPAQDRQAERVRRRLRRGSACRRRPRRRRRPQPGRLHHRHPRGPSRSRPRPDGHGRASVPGPPASARRAPGCRSRATTRPRGALYADLREVYSYAYASWSSSDR